MIADTPRDDAPFSAWMRRPVIVWLVVAIAVTALGAASGRTLIRSLNDAPVARLAALHAHADPIAAPSPPKRRVVVTLIDGLGEDAFDARLREGMLGDIAWRASLDSGVPSLSRPVYHAVLTGVPQWASGIRENSYARGRADAVSDRVRAGGGRVAWMLETVPWFDELFGAPGDVVIEGPEVTRVAAFARVWSGGADLVVLHLTAPDGAGHTFGADSDEYVAASRRAMEVVASFRAIAPDALWIVGADHGHMPRGGHGGPEESVRRVTWVALFDRSEHGAEAPVAIAREPRPQVTSLAPTIARALGVDPPRESMADGLPLREAIFGAPFVADRARVRAVEEARAANDAGFGARASTSIALAIAAFAIVAAARARRGLAEIALAAIAVASFVAVGPGLTLSAVRTQLWFLAHATATMALFAAPAWLALGKWASPIATTAACAVLPIAALVATRGSLGASDATPIESVLWPSLGLVPPSVCAAIALVEIALFARARAARSRAA